MSLTILPCYTLKKFEKCQTSKVLETLNMASGGIRRTIKRKSRI